MLFHETYLFIMYSAAGSALMLTAYLTKYRSAWREKRIMERRDWWMMKDNDDFLNYLAFEYRFFSLHFPSIVKELDILFRGTVLKTKNVSHNIDLLLCLLLFNRCISMYGFFSELAV